MQIGFVGLGLLGTPLAANLVEAGHTVFVYNRTASKAAHFKQKGATVAGSLAELAKQVEVIFSIVSDDAALKSICEGKDGLVQNARPGALHISMSTILPQTAAEMHSLHQQYNLTYIASPVFGRPETAGVRKMNFAVSGDAEAKKKAAPLMTDAGAAGIWDFGENIEAANTVKLCGNFLIAAALEAIGESTAMATKSGIDPVQMWNMFNQTILNAPIYHNYSNIILHQKFHPAAFTMRLGLKDLRLVLEQAQKAGQSMPMAELIKGQMEQMVKNGDSEIDWSAVSLAAN